MSFLTYKHLIASQDVQGYILINKTTGQCRADLFVPLEKLSVDDPQLRIKAGLNTRSSLSTIANTKKNMLKTIDAANFPFAQVHSSDCSNALSGKESKVVLTIHGMQQERQLAITMQQNQDEQLIIDGEFSILQTEFDIEPFSIFNGLIEFENKLDLTYKLIFTPIKPHSTNR
jgi:polyisoprenoid-binding protein YceI